MGQLSNSKILIVIFCLIATSLIMFRLESVTSRPVVGKVPLSGSLNKIGLWHSSEDITMPVKIVSALRLDDYFYRTFYRQGKTVTLYIGYYYSTKKVGAAHDPTVCFPGQGWVLKNIKKGSLLVDVADKKVELNYSTMIAERNGHRELLVYWFQADDIATSDTLSQKITLLRGKLLGGGENNAFVRIDTSLDDKKPDAGLAVIKEFIRDFYPEFISYVTNGTRHGGESL